MRTGLGVDGEEVMGLGFPGMAQSDAGGHVDQNNGSGGQGCQRNGAIGGFGFGDLRTRDGVEFRDGVAAGDEAFCYPAVRRYVVSTGASLGKDQKMREGDTRMLVVQIIVWF